MSSVSSNAIHASGKPDQRLLGTLTFLFLLTALTTSSCVNCCPDEQTTPPPKSAFIKLDLAGSAKSNPTATWRTKSPGQPILLLHALNGISPSVLHWALEMETWGYRVYIPNLYGDSVEADTAYGYDNGLAATKFLMKRPEWNLNSTTHPGAIIEEVRAFAKEVSSREGNREIAVIGNCLTGIFPLAIMDEPSVRLAILSQPAMPVMQFHEILFRIPQPGERQRALPLSADHLDPILQAIAANPSKRLIGFHYAHDPVAPILKFDQLHETLAEAGLEDRFTAYVMEKADASYAEKRPEWVISETTEQKRKMLTPHSTLSNPESLDDCAWFRARLREELDRAWE